MYCKQQLRHILDLQLCSVLPIPRMTLLTVTMCVSFCIIMYILRKAWCVACSSFNAISLNKYLTISSCDLSLSLLHLFLRLGILNTKQLSTVKRFCDIRISSCYLTCTVRDSTLDVRI